MADVEQARDAVQRRPEVIALALFGRAGMQRHPDAQAIDGRKILASEVALRCNRSSDAVFGASEGGTERVADRLEDVATVRFNGAAEDRVMASHRLFHRGTIAIPALCAALDVSKQERHRAGRRRAYLDTS